MSASSGSELPPTTGDSPSASSGRSGPGIWQKWELREHLLLPVLSSLATAGILFTVAAIFAPTIRRLFAPPGAPGFPLYCIVEPYNAPHGDTVLVDLFIINLAPHKVSLGDLTALLSSSAPGRGLSPDIITIADHPFVDSIVRVDSLPAENAGKALLSVTRVGPREYRLTVVEIEPNSLVRYTIVTNMVAAISSRANRGSNPVACKSPYHYQP